MPKQRVLQYRIASWFWIVLVIAAFFFGRNWDETWESLWRPRPASVVRAGPNGKSAALRVVIPAMGPVPLAIDFAQPLPKSPELDQQQFSFDIGFRR